MAEPTHLSTFPADVDLAAAEAGSGLLGLSLFEQGFNVARVLEAHDADGLPVYPTVAVLMPRRSTKTTSIWAVILGRCLLHEGHRVVTTAQDGTRSRQRFREVARILERAGFEDAGHKIRWANGDEALEFANGSRLWVVPPRSDAFRSEAADTMLFDEAGELDPVKTEDLLEGALPLMDTRPMGQVIIAGTPAKERAGLLWQTLEEARGGEPGVGIVDYSIRDDEDSTITAADGTVELNEDVVRRVHPGIGTLTTWAKMQARFAKMGQVSFDREYMCRFPFDNTTAAIDPKAWAQAEVDPVAALPERFGLAFDVEPSGASAAVCAAWRDEEGVACVGVLEHREGVSWLPGMLHKVASKYRVPVRYDGIGANHGPAEQLGRKRGVRLEVGRAREAVAAAQLLVSDLTEERLAHQGQASLNQAVEGAVWRQTEGGRLFGRRASNADVSPLVAASLALYQFDSLPVRSSMKIVTSAS